MLNDFINPKSMNKSRSIYLSVYAVLMLLCWACIKNDIPYPRIQANIINMVARDQTQGAVIDSAARTVKLYFPEETDLYHVNIESVTLTEGAHFVPDTVPSVLNLSSPVTLTVELYQPYEWTVSAIQDIERYFTIAGQIGSTLIDAPGRRVVVSVSDHADLAALKVESMKLGPRGCTTIPDMEGKTVNFTSPVDVEIITHGHSEIWTIYVETTASTVNTVRADAWTQVAFVYGEAQGERKNGIEYRLQGSTEWTRVPDEWITSEGGSFYARILHLTPGTTYEARAYSDEEYAQVLTFTTGSVVQVPNSSLDQWWLNGKVWCPWEEGGTPYWDTGNKGATTLGTSNSFPTEDTSTGSGWAAQLETRFVGIGSIGKLAAGNLFVGSYVRTEGTNGILSFGRPFKERPTKLRGYMKYKTAAVSSASKDFDYMKGKPDTCIIWCALIDQDEPFEIRTNPNNRQLFDSNGSYVVAYGNFQSGQDIPAYIPFEINLDYTSTSRVPKYILITASASKYGDYFTGGAGATLWLDDLELLYDY